MQSVPEDYLIAEFLPLELGLFGTLSVQLYPYYLAFPYIYIYISALKSLPRTGFKTPTSPDYYGKVELDSRDLPMRQRWKLVKAQTTHEVTTASLDEVPMPNDDRDIANNILGHITLVSFPNPKTKVISVNQAIC
ncbi:hypothetical protein F5146DRAFT_998732 [Armillaria mellea]|nr:hypothetical protein F5146DRAFT_998732 [Armillaria mellea]